MTINARLTIRRDAEKAREKALPESSYVEKIGYELGWTQAQFASVLNWIEARFGEAELEEIIGFVGMTPVHSGN